MPATATTRRRGGLVPSGAGSRRSALAPTPSARRAPVRAAGGQSRRRPRGAPARRSAAAGSRSRPARQRRAGRGRPAATARCRGRGPAPRCWNPSSSMCTVAPRARSGEAPAVAVGGHHHRAPGTRAGEHQRLVAGVGDIHEHARRRSPRSALAGRRARSRATGSPAARPREQPRGNRGHEWRLAGAADARLPRHDGPGDRRAVRVAARVRTARASAGA